MIIITGATGGVGKPLTKKVLSSGQICCAVVRSIDKVQGSDFAEDASNLIFADYQLDSFVDKLSGVDKSKVPHITLILNAFDISPIKMAAKMTKAEVDKNIEFNVAKQVEIVIKAWELSQQFGVPLRIVNVDSAAAYNAIAGWSLYCAAKAYNNMFLKVFAKENRIPVVLYDPGVIDTKMQETIRSSDKQDFPLLDTFVKYKTSNELNSPEEVANSIFERYVLDWTAAELRESFKSQ